MFRSKRRSGFTIVELLVVVGIVVLLMGLLLPALSGAKKKARKTSELNSLRQVGLAWIMYANQSEDAVPPGFMDVEVQGKWKVQYEFPGREKISPAPDYSNGAVNIAGPWTWRLMPYLDYHHDVLHGYTEELDEDIMGVVANEAENFSLTPAFGYNAYYCGGWWAMDGDIPRARYTLGDAQDGSKPRALIVKSIGSVRKSTEFYVFASAAWREPGIYKREEDPFVPGAHYVTPPYMADLRIWGPAGVGSPGGAAQHGGGGHGTSAGASLSADPYAISVFWQPTIDTEIAPAPVGRHNGSVAILTADGHVETQTPGAMQDPRNWINVADHPRYQHSKGAFSGGQ